MAQAPEASASYDIRCPHCKKQFTADVMPGSASRYNGFKCPHCRLFVPLERVEEQALLDAAE